MSVPQLGYEVPSAVRIAARNQACDGLLSNPRHADGGADGTAFNQATDDLGALFRSEAVHASIMRYRLRIVKHFSDLFRDYFGNGCLSSGGIS